MKNYDYFQLVLFLCLFLYETQLAEHIDMFVGIISIVGFMTQICKLVYTIFFGKEEK